MENEVKEPAPNYQHISPDEYLAMERASDMKHEYYNGYVEAMSGASLKHNQICSNLYGEIGSFLKDKNCRILTADMRVCTADRDIYVYPDATIVCGEPQLEDDKFDTLLNPAVVFEILSPSTRRRDAGYKFLCYKQLPSLQEYIMIDSISRTITAAGKQADGSWKTREISGHAEFLHIRTIDFYIQLNDIYRLSGL